MNKAALRQQFLERREEVSLEDRNRWSEKITQKVLEHEKYRAARVIFTFVSFRSEVNTHTLIQQSLALGKRVFVPVIDVKEKCLHAVEIADFSSLQPGFRGILEPSSLSEKANPEEIDLCLIPGAVFAKNGYRIGYGGGYYDRFLPYVNQNAYRLGVAFQFQLVDEVPFEKHDIPVHETLTELT